jgi:SsrA-binding protein
MVKKKSNLPKRIYNRRAKFDYELGDSFVAGLALSGAETKSLRLGHGNLRGAYVTVKNGELFLINATISGSNGIPISESDQSRARKLLIKRREINTVMEAKHNGRTIVPLELLTQGRYIKLRFAIGKGKKRYDKRETLKKREGDRGIRLALKSKNLR